jgi:PAS domain S-box-containing protein
MTGKPREKGTQRKKNLDNSKSTGNSTIHETLYEEIFTCSNDAIAILNSEGVYIKQNAAHRTLLGFPDEFLSGKTPAIHLGEDIYSSVFDTLRSEGSFRGNVKSTTYDERVLEIAITVFALYDDDHRPQFYVGVTRDVTEMLKAMQAMEESEERYRTLVENSPLGIAVHRSGKIIYANQSALKIIGQESSDDYIGRAVIDFIHTDSRDEIVERVQAMYRGEASVEAIEEKWVSLDGTAIDVKVAASVITYQGEPAVQVVFSDITDRKRAEEALRVSEQQYRILAENVKDVIWTVDLNLNFTYVSASVKDMLGYTVQEALAMPISDAMPQQFLEIIEDALEESFHLEETVGKDGYDAPPLEIDLYDKSGTLRRFEMSRVFLRDENDRPTGILGVARDITDRKLAEEALERAVAQAEFYNDLMAHDLANMQQGIMVSLEIILSEHHLPDHLIAFAESALEQTKRSAALIANVKKLASTSKQDTNLIPTDPYEVLIEAVATVRSSLPGKEIIFSTDLTTGEYDIIADEFLLDMFFNLLHNAVKADPRERVEISVQTERTEDDGSFLQMRFEDRGRGMSDSVKESVLTGMGDRERRGIGIGLTLVKRIADRYGGRVWIKDRVKGDYQQGTSVVLLLPLTH